MVGANGDLVSVLSSPDVPHDDLAFLRLRSARAALAVGVRQDPALVVDGAEAVGIQVASVDGPLGDRRTYALTGAQVDHPQGRVLHCFGPENREAAVGRDRGGDGVVTPASRAPARSIP